MAHSQKSAVWILLALVGCLSLILAWPRSALETASVVPSVVSTSKPIDIASSDAAASQREATGQTHALDPALQIAREALAHYRDSVDDYTALLVKRERISGTLGGETKMELKLRARKVEGDKVVRPLQVYLKMLDPWLSRGREVIWVEGRNEGKLIAHEGGLKNLMRISLAPTDTLAMLGNKYPITEIGLQRLIEKLIEKGERDKLAGDCSVVIEEGHRVGQRPCRLIQVTHDKPDPRFDFHIAQVFIDAELGLPLRYAAFLWPDSPGAEPKLEEEYTYLNVRLNVGLSDVDFDPDNPAYQFPK